MKTKVSRNVARFRNILSNTSNIHDKLQQAALYIKRHTSKMGIALLNEDEKVYIGLLTDQAFKAKMFKMPQTRNILRRRSQNYAFDNIT